VAAVLGVRCWSESFAYVVVSGSRTAPLLVAAAHVLLPVNDNRGAQLASFRSDIYDVITSHCVSMVYFRRTEAIAKTKDQDRAQLEGVLQELCYSHDPSVPVAGRTVAQLKSALKFAGKANSVFELFDQPMFRNARLAKGKFQEAATTALSGL